jgi:hypothetical protein
LGFKIGRKYFSVKGDVNVLCRYYDWLSDKFLDKIGDKLWEWFSKFILWVWNTTLSLSFWITCVGCVLCLIYYAAMKDSKPIKKMWFLIISYIILKGIDMSL